MEKIFLYKTITKSVAYDEEHWYIDNNPQQQNDGDGVAQFEFAVARNSATFFCQIGQSGKLLRGGQHIFPLGEGIPRDVVVSLIGPIAGLCQRFAHSVKEEKQESSKFLHIFRRFWFTNNGFGHRNAHGARRCGCPVCT